MDSKLAQEIYQCQNIFNALVQSNYYDVTQEELADTITTLLEYLPWDKNGQCSCLALCHTNEAKPQLLSYKKFSEAFIQTLKSYSLSDPFFQNIIQDASPQPFDLEDSSITQGTGWVFPVGEEKNQQYLLFLSMDSEHAGNENALTSLETLSTLIGNIFSKHKIYQELKSLNSSLEQQVKDRTKQLAEAQKMASLGQLVAGVAHEINTPIGVALTASSFLEEASHSFSQDLEKGKILKSNLFSFSASALDSTKIIQENLNRAAKLIQNFKQVAVDQSKDDFRTITAVSYCEELVHSLTPKWKPQGHTITVSGDQTLEVHSSPGTISQCLTILIINSTIHAFDEGQKGNIKIVVNKDEKIDIISIIYEDDGKGLSPDSLEHVFDPFFTTKRGEGGSGLGMHLLYNLIHEKLSGTVTMLSPPNQGFKLIINIPITEVKAS